MKLNKIEKIFVYVVILGLILIGGYFMFIHPCWAQIESSQKKLDNNRKELQELNTKLEPLRSGQLDQDITARRNETLKLEGTFFPDMTTYETVESTLAYLEAHNFEIHSIDVTELSTRDLSLEVYTPTEVQYELKTLAKGAKNENEEEKLVEGQFRIGNEVYTITVPSLSIKDISVLDSTGAEVKTYNEQMQKVIKAGLCRYAQENKIKQKVGLVQASFEITGTFEDYVKLIDSIYAFDHRAMMTSSVEYPMTITPSNEEKKDMEVVDETGFIREASEMGANDEIIVENDTEITQKLTLMYLSVEPMDPLAKVNVEGTDIVVNQRPTVY